MKYYTLILFLFLISLSASAQEKDEFDYVREFTYGFSTNTNSGLLGGFIFKKANLIRRGLYQTYSLELINTKHPKEIRYSSPTGNSFVYGKQNWFYVIRPQYGREYVLFRKAPEEGVQINALFAGGPSFGLLSPYYIQYGENLDYVQYNPSSHPDFNQISGSGFIFQGLSKSKIKLGLHAKSSVSFELGAFNNNVVGFETGFLFEAYSNKIVMMPGAENSALFTSAFFTLFYGSRK